MHVSFPEGPALGTRPPGRTAGKNVDGPHRRWLLARRAAKIDAMRAVGQARPFRAEPGAWPPGRLSGRKMRGQISRGHGDLWACMEPGESMLPLAAKEAIV